MTLTSSKFMLRYVATLYKAVSIKSMASGVPKPLKEDLVGRFVLHTCPLALKFGIM